MSLSYEEALLEARAMQSMFSKMTDQCFKKCVTRFGDAEIGVGEGACIDRCCEKYIEVQKKVGQRLNPNQ
jgi:import inner membrane translocase subunit TIM10